MLLNHLHYIKVIISGLTTENGFNQPDHHSLGPLFLARGEPQFLECSFSM